MKDKEIEQFIQKGHILIRGMFEIAGNPKEYVEGALRQYVAKLKEDPDYIFMKEYYADAEEHDGVWSTFFESEILVSNFEKLNILCFNLAPASIEILKPETFNLSDKNITHWYNDLISKIHETSAVIKSATSENDLLKLNLNRSIRNCVILALTEPKAIDDLVLKVGIDKDHLQPFLEAMIREKSIIIEEGRYRVNK